jgi:hypothetical protein
MVRSIAVRGFRTLLAAGALLVLAGAGRASAASFTVFWDAPDLGYGAGAGVSQATAQAAAAAGIPIVANASFTTWTQAKIPITHDVDESSLVLPSGGAATVTSHWTAQNEIAGLNDGSAAQRNLFLIYAQPVADTLILDGQQHSVLYDPSDVGLTLTYGQGDASWVILQVPIASSGNSLYLPAVSLGALGFNAAPDPFSLFYAIDNPQVFHSTQFIDVLGLPKWNLAYYTNTATIPEPSSGLLTLIGLLGIARARRKQS